ncbi:YigZ family protein [Serratia ureilytica]
MRPYPIPAEATCFTEEIKKSRLSPAGATSGVEAAKTFIQQVRDEHPAARHHCWPSSPAAPMTRSSWDSPTTESRRVPPANRSSRSLGSGIGEVTAVVVRYYGGVKLGTGGLVKAYGNGVQQALKQLALAQGAGSRIYLAVRLCAVGVGGELAAANRRSDPAG